LGVLVGALDVTGAVSKSPGTGFGQGPPSDVQMKLNAVNFKHLMICLEFE
jgi:hypothetical protein